MYWAESLQQTLHEHPMPPFCGLKCTLSSPTFVVQFLSRTSAVFLVFVRSDLPSSPKSCFVHLCSDCNVGWVCMLGGTLFCQHGGTREMWSSRVRYCKYVCTQCASTEEEWLLQHTHSPWDILRSSTVLDEWRMQERDVCFLQMHALFIINL